MTWSPSEGWAEVVAAELDPVLSARCRLLLLRIRLEKLAKSLPAEHLASGAPGGLIELRLWGLLAVVPSAERPRATALVRQVQRVYRLSSAYLHSRRSAVIPPEAELTAWSASVEALEKLADSERPKAD